MLMSEPFWMKRRPLVVATLMLFLGFSSRQDSPSPSTTSPDSSPNWLQQCTTQSECGAGGLCECGVCTKICQTPTDCRDPYHVVCAGLSWSGLPTYCQPKLSRSAPGLCVRACVEDSQCFGRQQCAFPSGSKNGVCIGAPAAAGSGGDGDVAATTGSDP